MKKIILTTYISFTCLLTPVLAVERPIGKTSPQALRSQCQQWSTQAKNQGVTQLIVVFEGLVSFSSNAAEKTYQFFDQVKKSGNTKKPKLGSMNFVQKNLLIPHMKEIVKKSELLLLSEASQRSKEAMGTQCVSIWNQTYKNKLDIIILGHSFGGYAALDLANDLDAQGIEVKNMLTMDARAMPNEYINFKKPANIESLYNFFHKGPIMPGYAIKGAEMNQRISTDHVGTTIHPTVHQQFLEIL